MRLIAAVLAVASLGAPAMAWDLDRMTDQIEKTNVIVSEICSGTIIDIDNRLVLTAHHCITNNLREVEKKEVDPKSGEIKTRTVQERAPMFIEIWHRQDYDVVSTEIHLAEIKGYDEASDTALLQITDTKWTPAGAAPFAPDDYTYQRGKPVFAVGNPGILFDNSVTTGIISAPERKLDFGSGTKIPLFQHSASVIGGNSGGAIYNDKGELIGTVTGGVRGADISLAVPISFSKELIRKSGFGKILEAK